MFKINKSALKYLIILFKYLIFLLNIKYIKEFILLIIFKVILLSLLS